MVPHHFLLLDFEFLEHGVHILFTTVSQCLALCQERNITSKRNKLKISKGEKKAWIHERPRVTLLQKEKLIII